MRSQPDKLGGNVWFYPGDCAVALRKLKSSSIDSCVTDPPYHLTSIVKRFGQTNSAPAQHGRDGAFARQSKGFMGKQWDGGDIAFRKETWAEVYRVLKPGAHLVAFCGTRNYHRLACAIEDAGFEIRDAVLWLYGSGFPKSHDVSKGIDRAAGAKRKVVGLSAYAAKRNQNTPRPNIANAKGFVNPDSSADITAPATDAAQQWEGWGTALKPAAEIICLARKPLSEKSVAANVLKWRTGAININGCRVPGYEREPRVIDDRDNGETWHGGVTGLRKKYLNAGAVGRWPANVVHDGSDEVVGSFPETTSGELLAHHRKSGEGLNGTSTFAIRDRTGEGAFTYADTGSAARFFYTTKADSDDRVGFDHPTVKPIDLMQWLVRLVTPKGGWCLDPFAGTGTTGEAAWREKCKAILIERDDGYQKMVRKRVKVMLDGRYAREVAKMNRKKPAPGGLFG